METWERLVTIIQLYPPVTEVLFSLLLVVAALNITYWVKKSTGRKQNTLLPILHIMNLLILATFTALKGVYYKKYQDAEFQSVNFYKFVYYQ